jgi:hypothetical protein
MLAAKQAVLAWQDQSPNSITSETQLPFTVKPHIQVKHTNVAAQESTEPTLTSDEEVNTKSNVGS